jgi:hypothetical protein
VRRATAGAAGRRGLIWLVMDIRDAGPRYAHGDRYSVDVIVLDGTVGPRAVYHGRFLWRCDSLEDSAYVLAPGVEAPAGLELEAVA